MSGKNFIAADIISLVVYFIAVIGIGLFASYKSNKSTVSSYFLAGRFMTWLPVGASLFASNIGSEHFIGLAGSGAAAGIGVAAFEFNACILLQLLGWVFLPVYLASGVCTLPEYMKLRFGGQRIQVYLACLSLLLYVLTKISVNLFAGSLFIQEAFGWNIWYSVLLLLAMTAIITIAGGLTAVIYTDTLQCIVMVLGASALSIIAFIRVGGLPGLFEKYGAAVDMSLTNATLLGNMSGTMAACGMPSEKSFVMLRPLDDRDMPWLGFLLGQTPASIWYWCADQMMVQRALAARSLAHAQGATLFAGYLKILPLFVIVMPGMISRVLYPDTIGCSTPEVCMAVCGQRSGCTNLAYPKLVMGLMPAGVRGVMMAVMLSALMSDLTSIFNSASTLFTVDIYHRFRRLATEAELVLVGRCFVLIMVIVSILWIPVIQEMQGGQLFIYIQVISAYLAPPIAAVYLLAVLWPRGTEGAAFGGLMYGLCLGLVRMVLDFIWREPLCNEIDTRPWLLQRLHYMYFALFSFLSTVLVMVLLTALHCIKHRTQDGISMSQQSLGTRLLGCCCQLQGSHGRSRSAAGNRNPVTWIEVQHWLQQEEAWQKDNLHSYPLTLEVKPNNASTDVLDSNRPLTNNEDEMTVDAAAMLRASHGNPVVLAGISGSNTVISAKPDEVPNNDHEQLQPSEEGGTSQRTWFHVVRRVFLWMCCMKSSHLTVSAVEAQAKAPVETSHEFTRMLLRQTLLVRVLLYANLAFLLSLTVALYLFFSLYFGTIKVGPGALNPWYTGVH